MNKENIYVLIDTEEKRLRALEILEKLNQGIKYNARKIRFENGVVKYLAMNPTSGFWEFCTFIYDQQKEIPLNELERFLLSPVGSEFNYQIKEIILPLDELKSQANALGYELIKKKREIKIGDFGAFKNEETDFEYFEFLDDISDEKFYMKNDISWDNFRHLTDEEKTSIQKSW